MFKLNSSTQMDTRGLWWGWDCPEELKKFLGIVWRDWVPASRCDFCIYEAVGCYLDVYFCPVHMGARYLMGHHATHYCAPCRRWIQALGWATHCSGKAHKANVAKWIRPIKR